MPGFLPRNWRYPLFAVGILAAAILTAVFRTPTLERQASRVKQEVAEIRGLAFKHPIEVRQLTPAEARAFVESEAAKLPRIEDYWAVMRMLGLHRGPDLASLEKIYGDLIGLAPGAYDTESDTFFQFEDLDPFEQRLLFAHELYHGLQNQHFDIKGYLVNMALRPDANGDVVLARTAVVEGEASYVDSIYRGRMTNDPRPQREQLAATIAVQAEWGPAQWEEAARNPQLTLNLRARLRRAIETYERMPRFLFESFTRGYLDGMAFIHAVHEKGWTEVEKLYREYPPESTEQILHPEKWFARESPVTIAWPSFDSDPLFADWQLLHENVLGESMWRLVFRVQGLEGEARSAAAGWGGDRYAVLRNRSDHSYLMLTFTSWDSPGDAVEFGTAYRAVLEKKAAGAQAIVSTQGSDVLIVEAPADAAAEAFMEFNRRAVLSGR
jgi:hypothetical protein